MTGGTGVPPVCGSRPAGRRSHLSKEDSRPSIGVATDRNETFGDRVLERVPVG
jgi:hypothetical protein